MLASLKENGKKSRTALELVLFSFAPVDAVAIQIGLQVTYGRCLCCRFDVRFFLNEFRM